VKCNQHVMNESYYPTLKTLDLIKRDYLHKILAKVLQQMLEKKIPEIKSHIEKSVKKEFNE